MDNSTKRASFLKRLGFTHDPFETPIAEQELRRLNQVFYAYYTPFYSPVHKDLLKALRVSQHGFIYGAPGQGKSTLRLTLDADCRTVFDGTLPVTYLMGEDITRPLTYQEHGERLTQALAIDLTLFVIEQFNPLDPFPSPAQIESIKTVLRVGGRALSRFLDALTSETAETDSLWGIGQYWQYLGKAPVKYIETSLALQRLLQQLKQALSTETNTLSGWEIFWKGVKAAQEWGFKQIFVLVDGIDSRDRDVETMLALLKPLLENLSYAEDRRLFFKFFLPTEMKAPTEQALKALYPHPVFSIMIEWDEEALHRLLVQRLRAAASSQRVPYPSLDSLAAPGLDLEKKAIRAAQGSPRRLLRIINTLIDVHLLHQPEERLFNATDWEHTLHVLENHPI